MVRYFRSNPIPFIDESIFVWYNHGMMDQEETFSMETKPKKAPCNIALLAHV